MLKFKTKSYKLADDLYFAAYHTSPENGLSKGYFVCLTDLDDCYKIIDIFLNYGFEGLQSKIRSPKDFNSWRNYRLRIESIKYIVSKIISVIYGFTIKNDMKKYVLEKYKNDFLKFHGAYVFSDKQLNNIGKRNKTIYRAFLNTGLNGMKKELLKGNSLLRDAYKDMFKSAVFSFFQQAVPNED